MELTRRLAILEAFASSKPTEFDAFAAAWEKAHPEEARPTQGPPQTAVEKPKRKK